VTANGDGNVLFENPEPGSFDGDHVGTRRKLSEPILASGVGLRLMGQAGGRIQYGDLCRGKRCAGAVGNCALG